MVSLTPASNVTPFRPLGAAPEFKPDAQLLIGPSPAMARLWTQVRLLAPHFRVALLTGEPGSGAEAVAQALHDLSSAAGSPLVHVRAAEAERQLRHPATLLGNSPRATLFISDIDRLSPAGQQALLRLLRFRRHRRIAVIASTSTELRSLISAGTFHSELFAHLTGLRIEIPSLRERAQDIPLLTHQLLQSEALRQDRDLPAIDSGFLTAVLESTWPGNLAQLRGALAWMIEHCPGPLGAADLERAISEVRAEETAAEAPIRMVPLDHVVQEHVRAVLIGCNGNKLRAAEVLGISRSTLYRMLDAASVSGAASPLQLLAS